MAYADLTTFGWPEGVHRAPSGYEHPWLVVTRAYGTIGCWSRAEARAVWRDAKAGVLGAA